MPARLSSIVRDIDLPGIWVSVDVHFEPTVMRYVLHGMAIERDDPAIELTGTLLRTVPIHELMRSATQQAKVKPLDRGNFKICPAGEFVPTEIESLINHFKLVMEGPVVPAGDIYLAHEGANGELGFYIVSTGDGQPHKVHVRSPSFVHMGGVHTLLNGYQLADIVTTFGSVNMIGGECDR